MKDETFKERLARLEAARSWKVGDKVRVIISGRTGVLARRCKSPRDGWIVAWDEPQFGVTEGRVATVNLERV